MSIDISVNMRLCHFTQKSSGKRRVNRPMEIKHPAIFELLIDFPKHHGHKVALSEVKYWLASIRDRQMGIGGVILVIKKVFIKLLDACPEMHSVLKNLKGRT